MYINYQEMLLPWNHLEAGEQVAGQLCPFCNGGEEKEKSFSVTRKETGVLVFLCHRNKCHRAGAVHPNGVPIIQVHPKTKQHELFEDSTESLSEEQLVFFNKVYGLTPEEIGKAMFLWVPARSAVWQPIYGPDGTFRGQVVRRYADKRIWTYKAHEDGRYPLLAWFPGPKGFDENHVVIVEDILSALKFSRYHNSVALNGTSMSNEAILEIMQWSKKQYLALDKDATEKAVNTAKRWGILLDIQVVECNRDPKYWSNSQLEMIDERATPL